MTAWAFLDSGFHFDLVFVPVFLLVGLVALRIRAVRRRRQRWSRRRA